MNMSLAAFANPCDPNPCGQGLCSLQGGIAVCQCDLGFSGENCSTRKWKVMEHFNKHITLCIYYDLRTVWTTFVLLHPTGK